MRRPAFDLNPAASRRGGGGDPSKVVVCVGGVCINTNGFPQNRHIKSPYLKSSSCAFAYLPRKTIDILFARVR